MTKIDNIQYGRAQETIRAIAQLKACPAWEGYFIRRCKEEKAQMEQSILTDLKMPAEDRQTLVFQLQTGTLLMEMVDRDEQNARRIIAQADREAKAEAAAESVL